jgi:hypothetical protein
MRVRKFLWLGVCLGAAATMALGPLAIPTRGQGRTACVSSQSAAVKCFVGNAVNTTLLPLHSGMTLPQFEAYGESQQTYLVMIGMASAISDAMPATDANGNADVAAQQAASTAITDAEINDGIVAAPSGVTQANMEQFSEDVVTIMDQNTGISLSPGMLLRVIDSYVVTSTTGTAVSWPQVDSGLATMLANMTSAGMVKLPASVTAAQVQQFLQDVAQAIYAYKQTTGRTSL